VELQVHRAQQVQAERQAVVEQVERDLQP
jgi:hypothetical protein